MKFFIFSVYDSKAETYGTPMFFPAKGQATRAFEDQANNPESVICNHPGDFTLFCIGEFNSDDGSIVPLDAKTNLGTGVDFKHE